MNDERLLHKLYILTNEEIKKLYRLLLISDAYSAIENIANFIFMRFSKYPSKIQLNKELLVI